MNDEAARVEILRAAKLDGRAVFLMHPGDRTDIVSVTHDSVPGRVKAAGLVTKSPGIILCLPTADAIPLVVWEKHGRAVGIFRIGWRAAAAAFVWEAFRTFKEQYGAEPADLLTYIGPHIKPCCYEVGQKVQRHFRPESLIHRDGAAYLDLQGHLISQLLYVKQPHSNFLSEGNCTSCGSGFKFADSAGQWHETPPFFSFHRSRSSDRIMTWISLDAQAADKQGGP
jgi:copper oxidase (laccase) domain-containing protein